MYASFQSLSEREARRKALLREAEKDISVSNHLEERYKDALWSADVQANRLTMIPTRSTSSAQTDATIPPSKTVESVTFSTNTPQATAAPAPTTATNDRVFSLESSSSEDQSRSMSVSSANSIEEEALQLEKTLQNEAHEQVKIILAEPNASNLPLIQPMFLSEEDANKTKLYFLDKNGDLKYVKSRKKVHADRQAELESEIDWLSTLNHLNEKVQGLVDIKALVARNKLRRGVESLKENVVDKRLMTAQAFQDTGNQKFYKKALMTILTMNRDASNKIKIRPFGRDDMSVLGEDYELNPITLELSHNGEVLSSKRANEIVSWEGTLRNFLTIAGANKLQLDIPKDLNIQYYAADRKHRLDDSTISNAPDTSRPRTDGNFETKITFIYRNNPFLLEIAPISPIGFDGYEQDYVFGQDGKLLKRDTKQELTGEELSKARASILWGPTYQDLVNELIDGKNWLESQPKLTPDRIEILNNFKRTLQALGVYTPLKQQQGRGLKGAGVMRMTRAGYNLRDIEGTGMASDLIYKRLGSKFVQVEKLNDGELKIVYPNRKTVGKRRPISPEVADILKTLIYDKTVDQDAYNKLEMDDKRLFHEILRITHTQYELKQPLQDPREALKQEYIKLKGELMLGNDNPEIIRELKSVLVDMYSAKLISHDEFKQVLMHLI